MNEFIAIDDIEAVLEGDRTLPSVVLWNRLEGRPRRQDFSRALKAEVRDPLWMLTKQWQIGEFKGDDAASPVTAKMHIGTNRIIRYQAGGPDNNAAPFDNETPLEATVEQFQISFNLPTGTADRLHALDIRLLMGRQWLKLLRPLDDSERSLTASFLTNYPIATPDATNGNDAHITAHTQTWQHFLLAAGRAMDGARLYQHLTANTDNHAYDNLTGLPVPLTDDQKDQIDEIGLKFQLWFERLLLQPAQPIAEAWEPEQLEYQFGISTSDEGGEKVLVADEYHHGKLDWYHLEVDGSRSNLAEGSQEEIADGTETTITRTFLPTAIQFDGMPNTRWWSFEDGRTNFGDIQPDTREISKLLLVEFGLIYSNDWFLVPVTLPVGSIATVKGLAVTDVFGDRTWIELATGQGLDDAHRWSMFNLSIRGDESRAGDASLLVLPTAPHVQEGQPVEDVHLIRDEVANMVWGIEGRIPLPHGGSAPGRESGDELHHRLQQILASEIDDGSVIPPQFEPAAAIRYELMTAVPENWIPFIPVHRLGSNREIQLQRAAMPRILTGDTAVPQKIRPRTPLLRQGLEESQASYINEDAVSRAGERLQKSYQRTRWRNGRVFIWLGARKRSDRQPGSSGLGFDQAHPTRLDTR